MKTSLPISAPIIKLSDFKNMKVFGKKTVLVGGAFDIIHIGHIRHLRQAKSKGDILVVQITGDKRYTEKRGYPPLISQKDRAKIISAIRFVDYVFISNKPHFDQKIVDSINPDILFFNRESFQAVGKDYVKNTLKFSGEIIVENDKKSNSSSDLRKKLIKSQSLIS